VNEELDRNSKTINGEFKMDKSEGGLLFTTYIQQLRSKQKFSLVQLCSGLCSSDSILAIENGTFIPERLQEECILDRLGVGAEDYERFLFAPEYRRWAARQRILHCITYEDKKHAGKLLAEYRKEYDMGNKLEKQFYLCMHAQIRRCRGGTAVELYTLFRKALALTVPDAERTPLSKLALSVKELNLLLETEHYRPKGGRTERYREILQYIEKREFDRWNLAKIYPKAVYYLCHCTAVQGITLQTAGEILQFCDRAVEILRNCERMYYLWEILSQRKRLAASLADSLARQGLHYRADAILKLSQENAEWLQKLEKLYASHNVPKETFTDCYLYVVKGVYCINDVIRIRRKMLGLSRKELCAGICDEKTLGRLERKQAKTHWGIVAELLSRLRLPIEYTRTELITSSQEARELMVELRICFGEKQWDRAEQLRNEIQKLIPMNLLYNQQAMMNKDVLIRWEKNKITSKEYFQQMRNVLELTLPYDSFLKEGEKYLTHQEQICIQNLMQALDTQSDECLTCMQQFEEMYQFFVDAKLQETVSNMYDFIMDTVGSMLGNLGHFDQSDKYNEIILTGCLRTRRSGALHGAIYGQWWNYDQRIRKGIPTTKTLDTEEEISMCIFISYLAKNKNNEDFYRAKLKLVETNSLS